MSKIGKLPIEVKQGITVTITEGMVHVKGTKGEMSFAIPAGISLRQEDGKLYVSQNIANDSTTRALFGLTRSIVANMVQGVDSGFSKKLELSGVGYRAQIQGNDLILSLGFSHPVKMSPLPGISFSVAESIITVSGIDKMLVGDVASRIRAVRPPEPYKGKGIKYVGEYIRRKAGKAAKAVGAAK